MEFDRILLVLPPAPSPVLTREAALHGRYQAKTVTIAGSWEVFRDCPAQRIPDVRIPRGFCGAVCARFSS